MGDRVFFALSVDCTILVIMRRYFQSRLLEAFYSGHPLRRTKLPAVCRHQQSSCRFLPSDLPDEDSDYRGVFGRSFAKEAQFYEMAVVVFPCHWCRHCPDPDFIVT